MHMVSLLTPLDTPRGEALAYFDAQAKQWRAERGEFDVLVGRSSAQIELRGAVTLTGK